MCSINLQWSLYRLKQLGRMWYNRLSEYLTKELYKKDLIAHVHSLENLNMNLLNLIGTLEELLKTVEYLKRQFEMKDLEKIKYCLNLYFKQKINKVLIHQYANIEKILKLFNIDNTHSLSNHIVVKSLDLKWIHSALKRMMKRYLIQWYHI